MRNFRLCAVAALTCLATAEYSMAGLKAFFYDRLGTPITTGQMYSVDLMTGELTNEGTYGSVDTTGMAFNADGSRLLAITSRSTREVWDYTSKPGTFIGSHSADRGVDGGLQYNRANGKWYALHSADVGPGEIEQSWLYEVNATTGAYTFVGSDAGGYCSGFAIGPDGKAYGIDMIFRHQLYSIDLATGQKSVVAQLSGLTPNKYSMCFDLSGKLWVVGGGNVFNYGTISTLDVTTGVSTLVANFSEKMHDAYGLAIVIPAPGIGFMVSLAGGAFAIRRRR